VEKPDIVVKLLKKQFEIVGRKYRKSCTNKENWYRRSKWTHAQKEQFKKFFVKTLKEDLMCTAAHAKEEFMWWDLGYGWSDAEEK
jgi:hypothetical protein